MHADCVLDVLEHGSAPELIEQDEEGLQTMRNLGHNMAWLMHCIELGQKTRRHATQHGKRRLDEFQPLGSSSQSV